MYCVYMRRFFFLMIRRPPRSTRTYTLFPNTTLFRSQVGTGGALPGFKLGTRVYLTLPNGERASFTFAPVEEKIGGQTFYRPAWVADGDHGFVLASVDAQLRRIGAAFFLVDGGAGYNPGARSEERRVGTECVRSGSTRWEPNP